MAFTPRTALPLILGVLMIGIGAYIALRPLLGDGRPVTPSRWLDIAFSAFFIIRGSMNLRAARRWGARTVAPDDVTRR